MSIVPYLYNINPSLQAPTRLPLQVKKKFLTYDVQASLLFPLSCKILAIGHGHKWGTFSRRNNFFFLGFWDWFILLVKQLSNHQVWGQTGKDHGMGFAFLCSMGYVQPPKNLTVQISSYGRNLRQWQFLQHHMFLVCFFPHLAPYNA